MQPSEGIPGIILDEGECRRVRAELHSYPASISCGLDPDVKYNLDRMAMIEQAGGQLRQYVLPAKMAQKLGEEMLLQADARLPAPRITESFSLPGVYGELLAATIRRANQRRFARQLLETSMRSRSMAPEQIQYQR